MSNESEPLLLNLLQAQHGDGGWSYTTGTSWTEPTCYALLALAAWDKSSEAIEHGRKWLIERQSPDGGWPPQSLIDQSTWVTSLACLALGGAQALGPARLRGIDWLREQTGQPTSGADRLFNWISGGRADRSDPAGWSWLPGTASWVTPTALALVSLAKTRTRNDERESRRARDGRLYLLSRRCRDGGWNHGGSFYRSEDAASYPETTGIALVGLQGLPEPVLATSLRLAEKLIARPASVEGASWLSIGLAAHGRKPQSAALCYRCRTTMDFALTLLAQAALEGRNAFEIPEVCKLA